MFFLDTYALIEVVEGNPSYKEYVGMGYVTSKLNLMEFYFIVLRKHGEKMAEKYYEFFSSSCMPFDDETIKNAMKFRLVQRSQKNLISYIDCVGYVLSLQYDIRFLTGEKHFLRLRNVEYVQ